MKQILILYIFVLLTSCYGTTPEKTGLEGKTLPNFDLLLTDSSTHYSTSQIKKGKPFAIFYFSPSCPYCKSQINEIISDMDRLSSIQFYFISSYPVPYLRKFCDDFKLANFKNILVANDVSHKVADYFEITGIPYMAIYGKDKRLNNAFLGKIYSSQIIKTAEE